MISMINEIKFFYEFLLILFIIIICSLSCGNQKPEKAYQEHVIGALQKNFELKTISDLQTLKIAIEQYIDKEGHYPKASNIYELVQELRPKYLSDVIHFDAWNEELIVLSSSSHITIISKGKDKQLNTHDDIKTEM